MIRNARTRVRIACFFLVLLLVQGLTPTVAWALTSGPVQPESKQFQAAGTNDMVDLFTGDFKYNIPLLDVGGYPVNLNYASGVGMDDEASWVGLGWNLNAGAMNRQIRGIADDANGDTVRSENYMKPKITGGGKLTLRGEIFGKGIQGSLSLGVFCDSYTGYGAEVGVNAGASLTKPNSNVLTPGVGIGLTSSTADGVTVTPSVSLSVNKKVSEDNIASGSSSLSLGFNTRQGLKELTLSNSYKAEGTTKDARDAENAEVKDGKAEGNISGSSISFNTPSFYPKSNVTFKSANSTYSGDLGGVAVGIFAGAGVTGYKTKREVLNREQENRAFGLLYAEKGANVSEALMDFMREKDNQVVPDMNNLALPIATPDIFSYTSQLGGGQVRLFRHSSGIFFDNETKDISDNKSLSLEYAGGAYFHGGGSVYQQDVTSTNGKWKDDNGFIANGDFAKKNSLEEEDAYFQQVGEKHVDNAAFVNKILGEEPVSVPISGKSAEGKLTSRSQGPVTPEGSYKKDGRQLRRAAVMYLTAGEARMGGLDKVIRTYDLNRDIPSKKFTPLPCNAMPFDTLSRIDGIRKRHHISEMTIVGDDGKRTVYGIPVYNKKQDEYSFASHEKLRDKTNNLATFKLKNGQIDNQPEGEGGSLDEYYHKESQPAYATSYLLSGILSPDYVDMTGDGITEDDRGTAFKFNYSKLKDDFHWRTPYGKTPMQAQFNRGLNADPQDDKASFIYGEKELWYLHSIESKTMIAYFITEDREDALGCNWLGEKESNVRQQRLKEIRLYSKNDLVTPVKTVVFEYDYSLCPGIPNSVNGGGKLTLKKVYFKYASSKKGENHPYDFNYNYGQAYDYMLTDRWGTLKPLSVNDGEGFGDLKNDEFPYIGHDAAAAAANAGMWHLSEIALPTGGIIDVKYESDDYGYVQDKKSMNMMGITGMFDDDGDPTPNLLNAKSFDIKIDDDTAVINDAQAFKDRCLNGEDYMYFKLFVNLSDEVSSELDDKYDYVACYGKISDARVSNGVARVTFEDDNDGGVSVNPFASAAWQRMRLEYQRYAYPGYKNKISNDKPVIAIVSAIANATGTLSELQGNFNLRAKRRKFASHVKLNKSFARVVNMKGRKLGGGARVKKIMMSDNWAGMDTQVDNAIYGQEYDYTIKRGQETISSGVAAYEPTFGGDENPLRQPVGYTEKAKWALSNYFYLEQPFAESLYPGPVVGYREVKVRNLGAGGEVDPANKTGWLAYEFFTAKEFPVYMQQTELQKNIHKPSAWSTFFGGNSIYELTMSQGYSVFLNDMHGKSKAERVYNQTGQEISAVEYYYNAEESGGTMRLKNVVDVVDNTGTITKDQVIGRDIEMFTDMRESEMKNTGKSINIGVDVIPFYGFPLPLPHFPWGKNDDYRLFRSSSVMKTVQYYGVIDSVVKRINGSSVTASYLLHDKYTGEPVVTQSENEFEEPVYSMSIPAYWMYSQMGMAYKTLGTVFTNFYTDKNGIPDPRFQSYLTAGDELINIQTGYRTWVVNSTEGGITGKKMRLIDVGGRLASGQRGLVKVCRSGYRNLLSAPATVITSLDNPIVGNSLKFISADDLSGYKIINANAILYDEAWGQPTNCNLKSCPEGYQEGPDGRCFAAAEYSDSLSIIDGSRTNKHYGEGGGKFYEGDGTAVIRESFAWMWMNRLTLSGIWLGGVEDGQRWGFAKCINLDTDTDVYIGHSADEYMEIYIDEVLFFKFSGTAASNSDIWNLRHKILTAGKHTIRVEGYNISGDKSIGFEIYATNNLEMLVSGEPRADILASRIMAAEDLANDPNVLLYKVENGQRVWANYTCAAGKALNLCDGTPNCGYADKYACPDGYKRSPDGQSCIPIAVTEDSDEGLKIAKGDELNVYTKQGVLFHDANGKEGQRVKNGFWGTDSSCYTSVLSLAGRSPAIRKTDASMVVVDTGRTSSKLSVAAAGFGLCGRLNRAGIWFQSPYDFKWIGVNNCLSVPESKTYYLGMGADNQVKVLIDGVLVRQVLMKNSSDNDPYLDWRVYPVYLTAGQHILTVEAMNQGLEHAVAVEVYNNTLSQLVNATSESNVRKIFTTADLLDGKPRDTYVKDTLGNIVKRRYSCPYGTADICSGNFGCPGISDSTAINPYLHGYLGNWLAYKQMAWLSSRSGQEVISKTTGGVGVRKNGYYEKFQAFWIYNNGWNIATNIEWVTSNTMTLYDRYSQDLENKDALNRYSAARYGYKSSLPVAVGANMRQREIFYDGFDDYKFNSQCVAVKPCEPDEFNIRNALGDNYADKLDDQDAHSGNYSLKLKDSVVLTAYVFKNEHLPGIYLINNKNGEYSTKGDGWLGLRGFNPVMGNKYIFSAWVKSGTSGSSGPAITVTVNNVYDVTLVKKAVVEGWMLVEGVMDVPAWTQGNYMEPLRVALKGNVNIDDIRVFPYDGQLKTFTYDDKTLRVMAEMDENNYATFYEYDDEGSLIRVKKETERGIMTIKETRSSYRKKAQ
ncbi:hypothetical protein C7475_1011206 [Chitinophaga sp. S165]|nr:hypothetical protein C7475_1011206 [Chitinophaga sp. S165]